MTSLGKITTDTNSATLDGIFSKLREIDSNFIGNGIVSVETSTSVHNNRHPKYLFDGVQDTYYHSNQASEKIITIDFHQNSFLLTKYVMQRYSTTNNNPSSWSISGFQGESLIPICSNNSFPISPNYAMKLFQCESSLSFNKFELRIAQKSTPSNNDNVRFSELEFFGILNPNHITVSDSIPEHQSNFYCSHEHFIFINILHFVVLSLIS